jgi:anaerobic magnesium-protoporphyrin IX monomethyl ester cyclase
MVKVCHAETRPSAAKDIAGHEDHMSRVMLVNPCYPDDDVVKRRYLPPIELGYVASLALQDGHEVRLVDANAEDRTAGELETDIEQFRPDFLLTVTSSLDRWICPHLKIDEPFRVLEAGKRWNNAVRTALIGPHGTTAPGEMMDRSESVDVVIRGEPELTAREWINAGGAPDAVAGITWRDPRGERKHNPDRPYIEDLDMLPRPAYHLLPISRYHYRDNCLQRPFAIVLASRGCPYRCTFCLTIMQGKQWRIRKPTTVADELEWLSREFGIASVMFFDYEFGLDRNRTIELCAEIRSRSLPLTWGCEMRVSDAREDVLRAMKEAGCRFVGFGVESGNQEILNKTRKGITLDQVRRAFDLARSLDISCDQPYWILGLPGETMETIEKTIAFSLELHSNSRFPGNAGFAVPYVGTEIHKAAVENSPGKSGTWEEVASMIGRVSNRVPEGDLKSGPFYRKIKRLYYRMRYGRLYFLNPAFYRDHLRIVRK